MKHLLQTVLSFGILVLIPLAGCSDSDSTSETLEGFEASQVIQTLDTQQIDDFCVAATELSATIFENAQSGLEESLKSVCALQAVTPGEDAITDEAACEQFVVTCVEDYVAQYGNLNDEAITPEDCKGTDWTQCSMTVGEFSTCMNDTKTAFNGMLAGIDSVTCAWAVTASPTEILEKASKLQDQAEGLEGVDGPPASCAALTDASCFGK